MELAVEGVLREVPSAQLAHYLGALHYAKPAKLAGDLEPPASMAAVRLTAMIAGVLPLTASCATRLQCAPAPFWLRSCCPLHAQQVPS